MAPLSKLLFLLSSCLTAPASSFLLPVSHVASPHKIHALNSAPNNPDDWFQSESTGMDVGGRGQSLLPIENDPFLNPSGMNKAGILQQQQQKRKPSTFRFEGYRGGEQQQQKKTNNYYPSSEGSSVRRPNLEFQQRGEAPVSSYEQWKQGDSPSSGVSWNRMDVKAASLSREQQQPPQPTGTGRRPDVTFQQPREEDSMSAYQQWKQGDNRPNTGGMPTSVGKTAPSIQAESRKSPPKGHMTSPDRPREWFQSDKSPNWPNKQLSKQQERDVPFEGRLTRQFSSTPDQPGAWFQSSDILPEESPSSRPSQTQSPKQQVRRPVIPRKSAPEPRSIPNQPPQGVERRPVIPKAGGQGQRPQRSAEPSTKQVRKPNIPRTQERRPKMPTRTTTTTTTSSRSSSGSSSSSSSSSNREWEPESSSSSSSNNPFEVESQVFQRYSAPPMQPQELRRAPDAPPRARAAVRERAPPMPENFPQPRAPTGAIMPLEPFNAGGPLGPITYSIDTPVLTGSGGRASRPYYDRYRAPEEVIHGAGSRKTWETSHHDQTIVEVGSAGRPVMATAQVWQGPGNTPARMTMYSEDGAFRPWKAAFQNTNRSGGNSVLDVRNDGPMAFPLVTSVVGKHDGSKGVGKLEKDFIDQVELQYEPSPYKITQTVQGQALKYFNIKRGVAAVMVELFSEGRPMFVQVELWQGPSATKQSAEIYSDNGNDRHWSAIIETHGQECVIAVRNVGPALVYPIKASVDPIFHP